jgi:glycosyltransferase involved in cell wall biosynthesis
MITKCGCGFAVPPDNPVAFADALERASNDRPALKAMGRRGHALAANEFDRVLLANQWVDWVTSAHTT